MTPKVLEKYLVDTGNRSKKNKKRTFFDWAKKHFISKSGKKEDFARNIDKILYGK